MPRYFTKEEAEALLPQIRPLMEEVQRQKLLFDEMQTEVEAVEARMKGNGHAEDANRLASKREALQHVEKRIQSLVERVQSFDAAVKDLTMGLIDFRARRGDQDIHLCWRVGESGINWWHTLDGGFAGRRPL